jgi:hypothetical protein
MLSFRVHNSSFGVIEMLKDQTFEFSQKWRYGMHVFTYMERENASE